MEVQDAPCFQRRQYHHKLEPLGGLVKRGSLLAALLDIIPSGTGFSSVRTNIIYKIEGARRNRHICNASVAHLRQVSRAFYGDFDKNVEIWCIFTSFLMFRYSLEALFTESAPLGRFSRRVAMSGCLSVCAIG